MSHSSHSSHSSRPSRPSRPYTYTTFDKANAQICHVRNGIVTRRSLKPGEEISYAGKRFRLDCVDGKPVFVEILKASRRKAHGRLDVHRGKGKVSCGTRSGGDWLGKNSSCADAAKDVRKAALKALRRGEGVDAILAIRDGNVTF